jgi:hypothetical protein
MIMRSYTHPKSPHLRKFESILLIKFTHQGDEARDSGHDMVSVPLTGMAFAPPVVVGCDVSGVEFLGRHKK